jgi:hypothetical protein
MYIVGHCHITRESRAFPEETIYGHGLPLLMFPDYVDCHHWAYERAWEADTEEMRLIQAHMVADWWVHFGPARMEPRKKIGWAYRRMRIATRMYKEFFGRAEAEGLRPPGEPADHSRGFAHSMLEYAIDTYLCRKGVFDPYFEDAKRAIQTLEDYPKVQSTIDRFRVACEIPDVPGEVLSYRTRADVSDEPEQFAFYAAARKFGLHVSRESADYVRGYQERILEQLDTDEVDRIIKMMADALAAPDALPRHIVDVEEYIARV